MAKPLSEMTLEELWQLFPIRLTAHQPDWAAWYQEERDALTRILPENATVHHIGSTAISGIWAKPIVDILVEVNLNEFKAVKPLIIKCGYLCMAQDQTHMDFNKGYTPEGFSEKVFHLHLREYGDHDELYFRDYLNKHPEIAREYETLKLSLWKRFEHDRDGYTNAKTDFVRRYTQEAKKQCGRYDESRDERI
ncbi:MAG: GrpB family protein [Lawsonibacter sp.]